MHRWQSILLIAVFFAVLLPLAASYTIHHPDEQYYTAGAIEMLESGDWATPRDEHRRPRFQKPPMAYWMIAVSYALFGVSPLSSRLPFLFAGCAVLFLTCLTARQITGDRRAGTFALLALFAQPQLVLASFRSMTDVVLTLGILLSAFGFLSVLCAGKRSRPYFIAAYGGVALAFLSKGAPAVLFVLYVFGFVLLDRRRKVAWKTLVEPVALGVAFLAVASWLAVASARHGTDALAAFWSDQTARRLAPDLLRPLWLAPALALSYVVTFLPWSMAALRLRKSSSSPRSSLSRVGEGEGEGNQIDAESFESPSPQPSPIRAREFVRRRRTFLAGWALLLAALFAGARELEEHYILPAVPFVAILIGDVLASADPERARRAMRRSFGVTLAVVLFLATLLHWAVLQLAPPFPTMALLVALTAVVAVLGYAALGGRWMEPATAQALVILLAFPLLVVAMRPVALPDQGEQLARRLEDLGFVEGVEVLFVGERGTAGKLRVASGGRIRIDRVDRLRDVSRDGYRAVILPRADSAALASGGDRIVAGSRGYEKLDVAGLLAAACTGRLKDFLARSRRELMIVVRAAHAEV